MILLAFVVLSVAAVVLLALAIHYLGIVPALAIAFGAGVLLFLAVKLFIGRLIRRLFMIPFRMKGAVLRNASVDVHAVDPLPGPPPGSAEGGRRWYRVDATITPRPAAGKFTHWEPGELSLVPLGSPPADANDDADDEEAGDTCEVHDARTVSDGAATTAVGPVGATAENGHDPEEDGGGKHAGPRRVLMTVGVRAGAANPMIFRYYFEDFGEVSFPGL